MNDEWQRSDLQTRTEGETLDMPEGLGLGAGMVNKRFLRLNSEFGIRNSEFGMPPTHPTD